jgi:hypothetical protein
MTGVAVALVAGLTFKAQLAAGRRRDPLLQFLDFQLKILPFDQVLLLFAHGAHLLSGT